MQKTPDLQGSRRERTAKLRRSSNAKRDKNALKEEVEQLLVSAGLACGGPSSNAKGHG